MCVDDCASKLTPESSINKVTLKVESTLGNYYTTLTLNEQLYFEYFLIVEALMPLSAHARAFVEIQKKKQ